MMTYSYLLYDPAHSAFALRLSENRANLLWDTSRGVDTLVIRTPFNVSAAALLPELCGELGSFDLRQERFMEIRPGIWARYVSAGARARMNGGCPLQGEACTYAVFACQTRGSECSVYAPAERGTSFPFLNVPLRVRVEVFPVMKKGGFFRSSPVSTGFYGIRFPDADAQNAGLLGTGVLRYSVGNMVVPVTAGMIARGTVYVKAPSAPGILSTDPGLQLN